MLGKLVVVVAVVAVAIGYTCYERYPDEIETPGFWRKVRLSYVAISIYARLWSWMGYGTWTTNFREFFKYPVPVVSNRPDNLKVIDTKLDGVSVRIYRPKSAKSLPGLVFIHGGAWIIGSVEFYDPLTRRIAQDGNIVVVSVEYGLSPENKFPVALDQSVSVTKYLLRNGAEYGADVTRISVSGDSAGGNLAAAVALKLRDENVKPKIKSQVLIYPVLQNCDHGLPIKKELSGTLPLHGLTPPFINDYFFTDDDETEVLAANKHLTSAAIKTCKRHVDYRLLPQSYVPAGYKPFNYGAPSNTEAAKKVSEKFLNPYAFPLMAESLRNLPETYMLTCGLDFLRDEDIIYAKRLELDGVNVEWVHYANTSHGVLNMDGISLTFPHVFNNMLDFMKRKL